MLHGKTRSRGLTDRIYEKEAYDEIGESEQLIELGKKYEADKAQLEGLIEEVENSSMAPEDKEKQIARLNNALDKLQEQYEQKVAEELKKTEESLEELTEEMQEEADERARLEATFRATKMEVSDADPTEAADEAAAQKAAFEALKLSTKEKLGLLQEQARIQARSIRSRKLRGR